MPQLADGGPAEILVNPLGLTSRTNPSQILESALGKLAALRGKPFKIPDFVDQEDRVEFALRELEKAGISDEETIVDPVTGRRVPNVVTGNRWFMKLQHTAESKGQGRGLGGYTADEAPSKGGKAGSKRIGGLETSALLSHGAVETLREGSLVRGQANPQYWAQYMSGFKPPTPRVPMVYHKFVNQLRSAGINVVREGQQTHIMALTDKDIDELAGDRELKNVDTVDWKTMAPVPGGLFDPTLTGGHGGAGGGGNRWSFIRLQEPMPSPVMEEPIRRLLGLTKKQFESTIAGEHEIDGKTGPEALSAALKKINIDNAIEEARRDIASGKRTARDAAVRKLGYLKSAKRLGLSPADWVLSKMPVLPPAFRPVSVMGPKKLPLVADPNALYRELWAANKQLGQTTEQLGAEGSGEERLMTYKAMQAVTGLGDPIHPKNQERKVKGVLKHVFGSSPKLGMLQRRLLSSTTDFVGRAVIAPDPDLDMDQIGLPEEQAWAVYEPLIQRRLVRRGMSAPAAAAAVEARSTTARQMMLDEMDDGVVVVNRAPTLHRYGMMAARPRLVKGHVLKVSPLVVSGFGADFDGNCCDFDTELIISIDKVVTENTLPGVDFLHQLQEAVMRLSGDELLNYTHNGIVQVTLPIGEFPRIGTPTRDRNGADVFEVPPGVSIPTYDHDTGEVFDAPVTHLTVEESHPCADVKTYRGRVVTVSDNESLAVFNTETGLVEKMRPADAVNKLAPVVKQQPVPGTEFDRDIGWWYGALVADGWVRPSTVGYSKNDDNSRREFERVARRVNPNFICHEYLEEKTEDKFSNSAKLHLNGKPLPEEVFSIYRDRNYDEGRGALYKAIPQQILSRGSRECLLGVLSGLLDGDRTLGWNTAMKNPRCVCKFNTSSAAFRDSMLQLCRYLGIRCSVTTSPARGKSRESYILMPALADIHRLLPELTMVSEKSKEWASKFRDCPPAASGVDIKPITRELAAALQAVFLPINRTLYSALSKAKTTGYLGEDTAEKVLQNLPEGFSHEWLPMFQQIVANNAVQWDRVKTVTETTPRQVFDLAVPGPQVFMLANGLIIYDTMQYHVPTTEAAQAEAAEKMLPSKNLLSASSFAGHYLPTQEYAGGLYEASSRRDTQPEQVFADAAAARRAWQEGRLDIGQKIRVLN